MINKTKGVLFLSCAMQPLPVLPMVPDMKSTAPEVDKRHPRMQMAQGELDHTVAEIGRIMFLHGTIGI
jgi:hypothetical protein